MEFYIKQKALSLGDKYNVTDGKGNLVLKVKSKWFSVFRHKKYIQDANGNTFMTVKRQIFDILPNYIISDGQGKMIAKVKRRFSINHKFIIKGMEHDIELNGDLFSWNYNVTSNGSVIGTVYKKFIHLGDSYVLNVAKPNDIAFMTALVVVIDNLCHNNKRNN